MSLPKNIGTMCERSEAVSDQAREIINSLSPIPCTQCEYCLPCPNGVNIPRNFDVYNQVAMYNALEDRRLEYKRWIPDAQKAAACIQCDECLTKCPQQIAISTWLPIVDEVLGLNHSYVKTV